MTKILLLTNILPPYRIPLFNTIHKMLAGLYEFKIAFMAEKEKNREWRVRKQEVKAQYVFLPGWHLFLWKYEFPVHINWGIWNLLLKENPDIIISGGYSYPSCWAALPYCKLFKKKLILWTSTTLESVKGKGVIREILRRIFIKNADAFVTYGTRAADFLRGLGINSQSIFVGCNVGDMEFFAKRVLDYRQTEQFKRERSRYEGSVLLFVGRLNPRKGLMQLLLALAGLKSRKWSLIIGGNVRGEIENFIERERLKERVQLVGFHEKEELVKFYALADVFILPSLLDRYAIVVSEAVAAGLFIVASKYDGAAWDLITHGENGLVVDPLNVESLRLTIEKGIDIISTPGFSRGKIVRSISHLTPDRYAQTFVDAIEYVQRAI